MGEHCRNLKESTYTVNKEQRRDWVLTCLKNGLQGGLS